MSPKVSLLENPSAAAAACGERLFALVVDARRARGTAFIAVSGGSTPRLMFEWLARQSFDWKGVHIFQVDARCVPPGHERSNFRMLREALLDTLQFPAEQIHRVEGEAEPVLAANRYAAEIRQVLEPGLGELPIFDVIHRGMGSDAHTASLFPGEPLLADRTGVAAAVWVEKLREHRVTLLPGVLLAARHSLCLACGADKTDALWEVLRGERDEIRFPAQLGVDRTEWFVDRDAAARL